MDAYLEELMDDDFDIFAVEALNMIDDMFQAKRKVNFIFRKYSTERTEMYLSNRINSDLFANTFRLSREAYFELHQELVRFGLEDSHQDYIYISSLTSLLIFMEWIGNDIPVRQQALSWRLGVSSIQKCRYRILDLLCTG